MQDGVLKIDIFKKPLKIEILKNVEQDSGMKTGLRGSVKPGGN